MQLPAEVLYEVQDKFSANLTVTVGYLKDMSHFIGSGIHSSIRLGLSAYQDTLLSYYDLDAKDRHICLDLWDRKLNTKPI
jgi:hypothetical protein